MIYKILLTVLPFILFGCGTPDLPHQVTPTTDRSIQSNSTDSTISPELDGNGDNTPSPSSDYAWTPRSDGKRLTGGGKAGYLKACGKIQFGADCNKMKKDTSMVTEDFAKYMMDLMPKCVSQGLKAQGYSGNFSKLVIIGDTYANREIRGGGSLSMHSTGRGIDLWNLNMILANGQKFNVDMTKSSHDNSKTSKFYKSVVTCWQNANKSRCSKTRGLTPRSGALDCTFDRNHHNHVHLSMPFCPHKRGIAQN